MAYTLSLKDINEIVLASERYEYSVDDSGTKEMFVSYEHRDLLEGWYKEIQFDNFRIGYGKNKQLRQTEIIFDFDEETVELHFTLSGASTTHSKDVDGFSMSGNSHNIFYCDGLKGNVAWYTDDIFLFEVNLRPSFFMQYLPNEKIFNHFKNQMLSKKVGIMNNFNYPITPQMQLIIHQIINCAFNNSLRRLFIESKVLELLMLQLEQISQVDPSILQHPTDDNMDSKMYYAKEIIEKNLTSPLTLSELSLAINTNECTLKKNFKATFGTTVFGYVKELKMNNAKYLLLNQQLNVAEVAERIGYKNPQHFSTAFKKYFGTSPSVLKY